MVHAQMHHPVFHSHNMMNSTTGHTSLLQQLSGVDADGDEDAVYLSPLALGLAALLLIINGLLSAYLSLGLHKTLGIAAIRQVAQHVYMQLSCAYMLNYAFFASTLATAKYLHLTFYDCRCVELCSIWMHGCNAVPAAATTLQCA